MNTSLARPSVVGIAVLLLLAISATSASAQSEKPAPLVEGGLGYAGFIDSPMVKHLTIQGGGRVFVTRRIAIGPEVVYMRGPGTDRDLAVTGNATFDLVRTDATRARQLVPYLVASGGFTRSSLPVGTGQFVSYEGAASGGGGVRIPLGRRLYIAPEARLGWEPLIRMGVTIGWQ